MLRNYSSTLSTMTSIFFSLQKSHDEAIYKSVFLPKRRVTKIGKPFYFLEKIKGNKQEQENSTPSQKEKCLEEKWNQHCSAEVHTRNKKKDEMEGKHMIVSICTTAKQTGKNGSLLQTPSPQPRPRAFLLLTYCSQIPDILLSPQPTSSPPWNATFMRLKTLSCSWAENTVNMYCTFR